MLTEEKIKELEGKGFKRWTKNGVDRLYINATALGLDCTYYKTGNISGAEFQGERISNSEAYRMKTAKTYININTGHCVSNNQYLKDAAMKLAGIDEVEE